MGTDKNVIIKGVKLLAYTVGLMFMAPVVLYQAFKNTDHSFYIPVLLIGILLAIGAIALGFYGIRVIMRGFFSDNNS